MGLSCFFSILENKIDMRSPARIRLDLEQWDFFQQTHYWTRE